MLYRMRLEDGAADPTSSGTFVAADGGTHASATRRFQMAPLGSGKATKTGANYPIDWRVELPEESLQLEVRAAWKIRNSRCSRSPIGKARSQFRGTRGGQRSRAAAIWN